MKGWMNRLRSKKGHTLVELMTGVFIATIAFGGAAQMHLTGATLSSDNRSRMYALSALREQFEIFRNYSSADFTNIDTLDDTEFDNDQIDKLNNGEGRIYVDPALGADLRKVTLEVTWDSRTGTQLSETVATYVGREGMNGV